MKKVFAVVLVAALMAALIPGVALAGPDTKGNGLPKGDCYNLNIIGVNQKFDEGWTGGEGKRIFVQRTGITKFLVGASDHYEVLDKNGTDGWVGDPGTGANSGKPIAPGYEPGIVFPTSGTGNTTTWNVEIYVRYLGPKDSLSNWKSYYYDTVGNVWVKWHEDTWSKETPTKFSLKTGDLLKDGYENMMWELEPVNKFRIIQMRIFLAG
jgi:hypothetical protein